MEGKAALGGIELITGYAQIRKDAVCGLDACVAQDGFDIGIIAVHKGHIRDISELFFQIHDGVGIAVDGDQPPIGGKLLQNGRGMSAAAGGAIHINAVRFDPERINGFVK